MKKLLIAVAVVLLAGAGGAYWYVNDRAKDLVDTRIEEMVASGTYDSAEYEKLNVSPTGDITMTNLKVVQGPLDVTLRNITITNLDYANRYPRHFDLSVDGMRVAPVDAASAEGAALATMLGQLGTDRPLPVDERQEVDGGGSGGDGLEHGREDAVAVAQDVDGVALGGRHAEQALEGAAVALGARDVGRHVRKA